MPDVTIAGTDTTITFPDNMTDQQIAHVLSTHPMVKAIRYDSYLAPHDSATEAEVAAYTQKWLSNPNDQGAPQLLLNRIQNLPGQERDAAIPPNWSAIGKLAIMRAADRARGLGGASIGPAPAAPAPNALERFAGHAADVLGYPSALVKAGVMMPLEVGLRQRSQGWGVNDRTPADQAEVSRLLHLPLLSRAAAVEHQDLRALGQPDKAQQLRNRYEAESFPAQLVERGGELLGGMAVDPLAWGMTGPLSGALSKAPLLSRAVAGGFAANAALPFAANPHRVVEDPASFIAALPLIAGGTLGAVLPHKAGALSPAEAEQAAQGQLRISNDTARLLGYERSRRGIPGLNGTAGAPGESAAAPRVQLAPGDTFYNEQGERFTVTDVGSGWQVRAKDAAGKSVKFDLSPTARIHEDGVTHNVALLPPGAPNERNALDGGAPTRLAGTPPAEGTAAAGTSAFAGEPPRLLPGDTVYAPDGTKLTVKSADGWKVTAVDAAGRRQTLQMDKERAQWLANFRGGPAEPLPVRLENGQALPSGAARNAGPSAAAAAADTGVTAAAPEATPMSVLRSLGTPEAAGAVTAPEPALNGAVSAENPPSAAVSAQNSAGTQSVTPGVTPPVTAPPAPADMPDLAIHEDLAAAQQAAAADPEGIQGDKGLTPAAKVLASEVRRESVLPGMGMVSAMLSWYGEAAEAARAARDPATMELFDGQPTPAEVVAAAKELAKDGPAPPAEPAPVQTSPATSPAESVPGPGMEAESARPQRPAGTAAERAGAGGAGEAAPPAAALAEPAAGGAARGRAGGGAGQPDAGANAGNALPAPAEARPVAEGATGRSVQRPGRAAAAAAPAQEPAPGTPMSAIRSLGTPAAGQSGPRMAANINLDKLDTPDAVKQRIAETAAQMADEIAKRTRGRVSWEETRQAARDLGLTPEKLAQVTPGTVLPAHYALAVRELLAHSAERVHAAEADYRAGATPEKLAELTLATKEYQTVLLTATGAAAEAGRALNQYKMAAQAVRGTAKGAVEDPFGPPIREAANPRSRGFGRANKLFTEAAASEARARLQQKMSRLSAGVDPTMLADLVEIGGYYVEGGLREFASWAQRMRQDVSDKLDEATLQHVWASVRAEAQERAEAAREAQPKAAASQVFVEQLAQRLGTKGAGQFVQEIAGPEGDTRILDAVIHDTPLSDEDKKTVVDAYKAAMPERAPAAEPTGAFATIAEGLKEAAKQARDAARAAKQAAAEAARPAPNAADAVRERLLKEIGENGDAARLAQELADIKPGDTAGLNRLMARYAKVPTLDKLSTVIKAGLISSPRTIGKIVASHLTFLAAEEAARVPAAIADMAYSAATGTVRQVPGLSLAGMTAAAKEAATRGVREAWTIFRHGEGALALEHLEKGDNSPAAQLTGSFDEMAGRDRFQSGNRLLDGYVNTITGSHSAIYHLLKIYALTRSLYAEAQLAARADAATAAKAGQAMSAADVRQRTAFYMNNPTDTMTATAISATNDATFVNDNAISQAVSAAKRAGANSKETGVRVASQAFRFGADRVLPFTKVPTNVIGKVVEYSPGGIPYALARLGAERRAEGEFTPEMGRRFAMTFGRGAVGLGVFAAGYLAAKHGLATGTLSDAADRKRQAATGEAPGAVKVGGAQVPVAQIAPVGNIFSLGASFAQMDEDQRFDRQGAQRPRVLEALYNAVHDQPLLSGSEMVTELASGAKKGDVHREAGSVVSTAAPTFLADLAELMDKGTPRERNTVADYLLYRTPGARSTLPQKQAKSNGGSRGGSPVEREIERATRISMPKLP